MDRSRSFVSGCRRRFKNIEVSGANIRQRDQNGQGMESGTAKQSHRDLHADVDLGANVERKGKGRGGRYSKAAGVEALGVERETGIWTVAARAPLQVSEKSASSELIRIDSRELPEWAGKADDSTVLAYRYLRPG
jgi:hypothetical protein